MSVTKDGDTGRWMSQIRVTDWTGKTIRKKKRGFATKKEALQWERDFISQSTGSLGMTFGDFISLYVKDLPFLPQTLRQNTSGIVPMSKVRCPDVALHLPLHTKCHVEMFRQC